MSPLTLSPEMGEEQRKLWLAVLTSIGLHMAFLTVWPMMKLQSAPPLEKLTVTISTLVNTTPEPVKQPATQASPIPETSPAVKPAERKVLSTPSPSATEEYTVPETPAEPTNVEPAPATASVAASVANAAPGVDSALQSAATATNATPPQDRVSDSEAWDGYGQALYDMVNRNKTYPQMAVRRHLEGDVKVRAKFVLGNLQEVTVIAPCDHEILNSAAVDMVRKAAQQMPVKGKLDGRSFSIEVPVSFRLDQ